MLNLKLNLEYSGIEQKAIMKYKEKLHIRHKKMNLRELCHYVKFKSGFGWIKNNISLSKRRIL